MRDMRDALGALGPVSGKEPELNNLTVAMTVVDPGDIVFLTSDGISDNFDPVVGKFAMPKKESAEGKAPAVTPEGAKETAVKDGKSNKVSTKSKSGPDMEVTLTNLIIIYLPASTQVSATIEQQPGTYYLAQIATPQPGELYIKGTALSVRQTATRTPFTKNGRSHYEWR